MSESEETCRVDIWLWRARFFKTRTLAASAVERDGVRLCRDLIRMTLEKASRQVRVGDRLSFVLGPRWISLQVEALGERRGPASEARGLFTMIDADTGTIASRRSASADLINE